jgi:protein JSN1
LNGHDILGSDIGPIRIGYARVQTKNSPSLADSPNTNLTLTFSPNPRIKSLSTNATPIKLSDALSAVEGASAISPEKQISAEGGGVENYRSQFVIDLVKAGVAEEVLEKGLAEGGTVSEEQMIIQVLGGGRKEEEVDVKAAAGG